MLAQVSFGILATCLLVAGFLSATSRHLVHSVLWLAVTLVATGGVYATLGASFLAGIQVLLYAGGVITLMLFGVMLTDTRHDIRRANPSHRQMTGALCALTVFGIIAGATFRSPLPQEAGSPAPSIMDIGASFLGPHLLAFEVLSMLLLAAVIGAIVLARRSDP